MGLQANAAAGTLRIAPIETPLWRRVEVTGLHFAGHRIDFAVDGTDVKVGAREGNDVEVASGLKEGKEVAVPLEGEELRDGAPVTAVR